MDVIVRAGCEEVLRGNPDIRRNFFNRGAEKGGGFMRNARGILLRR